MQKHNSLLRKKKIKKVIQHYCTVCNEPVLRSRKYCFDCGVEKIMQHSHKR